MKLPKMSECDTTKVQKCHKIFKIFWDFCINETKISRIFKNEGYFLQFVDVSKGLVGMDANIIATITKEKNLLLYRFCCFLFVVTISLLIHLMPTFILLEGCFQFLFIFPHILYSISQTRHSRFQMRIGFFHFVHVILNCITISCNLIELSVLKN